MPDQSKASSLCVPVHVAVLSHGWVSEGHPATMETRLLLLLLPHPAMRGIQLLR